MLAMQSHPFHRSVFVVYGSGHSITLFSSTPATKTKADFVELARLVSVGSCVALCLARPSPLDCPQRRIVTTTTVACNPIDVRFG